MIFSEETWRPVLGYEGIYSVSDLGRVRCEDRVYTYLRWGRPITRQKRARVLKPAVDSVGYLLIKLRKDGAATSFRVHRLVLEAFVGPRPEGMVCRHLNDTRTDNALRNLSWGTGVENSADAARNGRPNQNAKKTHCPQGHPYSPDNTMYLKSGSRSCRTCKRISYRKWQGKRITSGISA